jgi:hypothetical protein
VHWKLGYIPEGWIIGAGWAETFTPGSARGWGWNSPGLLTLKALPLTDFKQFVHQLRTPYPLNAKKCLKVSGFAVRWVLQYIIWHHFLLWLIIKKYFNGYLIIMPD